MPPDAYPTWSVIPFALLLLAIATLPLVSEIWWHRNRNKALVAALFGIPVVVLVALRGHSADLAHTALEYAAFVSLLGSLFVISGGIEIRGAGRGTAGQNTLLLASGAVLANLVGTTGASMLLIRPFLRANAWRRSRTHQVVFFTFTVSNIGGCLTPLGDPPLFLGFLKGVPFEWTLRLWQPWLAAMAALLAVFWVVDARSAARDGSAASQIGEKVSFRGGANVALLLAVVGVILAGGKLVQPRWGDAAAQVFQAAALAALAAMSLAVTPREARAANDFSWHPFVEVTVLFAGIFAAMIPALGVLRAHGENLHLVRPWQFFWATGSLSALLDNAPTYLAFLTAAQHLPDEVAGTTADALAGISCGAVFFGAMTYIGNGPNFMVKAIADHAGVRMPSFFGYLAWSLAVLVPLFAALTFMFFR
jgi:Na+/H+ antiporter NhaD/arsenite permease-like protein